MAATSSIVCVGDTRRDRKYILRCHASCRLACRRQALAAKLTPKSDRPKCAVDCEIVSLAELTRLAERVIAKDQLQTHIDATVDTYKADYAIVSAPAGDRVFQSCFSTGGAYAN